MALLAISVFGLLLNGTALVQANANPVSVLDKSAARDAAFGKYDDAVRLYTKELNLLLAGGRRSDAGSIYIDLAEISHVRASFPSAERNYKRGIDLLRHYGKPADPYLVRGLDGLGWLYVTWGRDLDAMRTMDEARAAANRAGLSANNLLGHLDTQAAYLTVINRYSDARKEWNRALDVRSSSFGPDSADYDILLLHFGQASALYGDYSGADQLFRRYIDIEDHVSSDMSISRAIASAELGHVELALHHLPEARRSFDQAMAVFRRSPDEAPLVYSMALNYLGDLEMAQRNWSAAEAAYRQALDIRERALGDEHPTADSMISLSKALRKLHRKREAKELLARAHMILTQAKDSIQDETVDVLALRGQ